MFENKSILEIISLIKSKEILVKEVVEFYIERIKKYNPALNAIVLQKEEDQLFLVNAYATPVVTNWLQAVCTGASWSRQPIIGLEEKPAQEKAADVRVVKHDISPLEEGELLETLRPQMYEKT